MKRPFRLNRTVKILLIVFGVFVVSFLGMLAFLADRIERGQDPVAARRIAAQIANFTVPKGFRASNALDIPIMKQAMYVSTDPKKPMTIVLQGMFMAITKESMDQSFMLSLKSHCRKMLTLGDDLLTVNGALFASSTAELIRNRLPSRATT